MPSGTGSAHAPARGVHAATVLVAHASAASGCAGARTSGSRLLARKVLKTSAFLHVRLGVRIPIGASGAHPRPASAADGAGKRGFAPRPWRRRVLTPKKTVIRFRHNNRWPHKRVSATQATTRDTTQSSARMVVMVDSGVVSLAKVHEPANMQPVAPRAAGFFVLSGTVSGTTRPARRRLTAGPIPAVRFPLGSSTCKSH